MSSHPEVEFQITGYHKDASAELKKDTPKGTMFPHKPQNPFLHWKYVWHIGMFMVAYNKDEAMKITNPCEVCNPVSNFKMIEPDVKRYS